MSLTIVYRVLYALLRTSTLSKGPLSLLAPTQSPTRLEVLTLQRVLVAYYRILHANRVLPRTLRWSLRPLSQLIWVPYPDNGVRLLAIRCYAMQAGMAEGERVKMEKEALGEVSEVNCPITLGVDFQGASGGFEGDPTERAHRERYSQWEDDQQREWRRNGQGEGEGVKCGGHSDQVAHGGRRKEDNISRSTG